MYKVTIYKDYFTLPDKIFRSFYHWLNIVSILDLSNVLARTTMLSLTQSITHFPVILLSEGKAVHKKLDVEIVK